MAEDTTITDAMKANAAGPKAATGDSGSVEMHDISDQIEADKYLKSQAAANQKNRGLRMNKIVPGNDW